MLEVLIVIFLLTAVLSLIIEYRLRLSKWRQIFFIILMLLGFTTVFIHYRQLVPLAVSDRLEVRGQYFPLDSNIKISGDPAEANYYAPSLTSKTENGETRENPVIELSCSGSPLICQVMARGTARPLRHNDQIVNVRALAGKNRINVGDLDIQYERGMFSGGFIINGNHYKFSYPSKGEAISVGEILCRAGFTRESQYEAIFPSVSAPGTASSPNQLKGNPMDYMWLVREGWRSFGLVNEATESVLIDDVLLPSEYKFSINNGDKITYGIGNQAFAIKVQIEVNDNRVYLIPERFLDFPLYRSEDRDEDSRTQIFVSSSPTISERAYQLPLGSLNYDLIRATMYYDLNGTRSAQAQTANSTPDLVQGEPEAQITIPEGGFVINTGSKLQAYNYGDTALIGSNRGGILISLNRKNIDSWRPILNSLLIWALAAIFYLSYEWISKTNYMFVLIPCVQFILGLRLVLSYRGYVMPPHIPESYEKALFAAVFIPFAIFVWLNFRDLVDLLDFNKGTDYDRRFLGPTWRASFVALFSQASVWYLMISLIVMWVVGAFSSSFSGVGIMILFFLFTLLIAKILSPTLYGNATEHPILAWMENGLEFAVYPGSSFLSRLKARILSISNLDIWFLLLTPILLTIALRVSGFRSEGVFGFRSEILYNPCLFLGSCRLYMWFFREYFQTMSRDFRKGGFLWLLLPLAVYFVETLLLGDWGFFMYVIPVLCLAIIISWRANRFVPFIILGAIFALVFLLLKTSWITQDVAALLPDNSTIQYRYLAYQDPGWLQEAALRKTDEMQKDEGGVLHKVAQFIGLAHSPVAYCRTGSSEARRIFGIHEHFWTMFHFAARGMSGEGYGSAPIEQVPFADGIAQSDNTYSIYLMSEHGGLGAVAVLVLYAFLSLLMIFILTQHFADEAAPTLIISGIALMILFSVLYHASGNIGAVPFTGKNFPFLSLNSISDILHMGLLIAIAFTIIGNNQEDLPLSNVGVANSFLGEGNVLNRWLLLISSLFVVFLVYVAILTKSAATNPVYTGDYNLEKFVTKTQEYIADDKIYLDENKEIKLRHESSEGLSEGQYLRLLIDQFNGASPEEKKFGKYFFIARELYLDEDIYGSDQPRDRYTDTVLTVDRNYFKRISPFAKRTVWTGGLRSSDSSQGKQGHLLGEGISLFFRQVVDSDNPIPGVDSKVTVELPQPEKRYLLANHYTDRRFRVLAPSGEELFDVYAVEDDVVLEPRAGPVSLNGQQVDYKTRLEPGDIIALGPSPRTGGRELIFAFDQSTSGVIAHYQWLNGQHKYTYPLGESFSLARPIAEAINTHVANTGKSGRISVGNDAASSPVTLSLNADLNRKLYEKVREAGRQVWSEIGANRNSGPPPRVAMTVMDPETGEVLALASWPSYDPNPRPAEQEKSDPYSYTNLIRRRDAERYRILFNHNLTRHVIGSATKPFIASASASVFPELLNLEVEDNQANYEDMLGVTTRPGWRSSSFGRVNWDNFLIRSNNLYAVTLGFLGIANQGENGVLHLTNARIPKPFWINGQMIANQPDFGGRMRRGSTETLNLDSSPLAERLNRLFDIQISGPDRDPITGVWRQAKQMHLLPDEGTLLDMISPEMPNLALNSIRDARQFVMVCLGGKTNLWSNIKSAEAFSRLVTGRRISATMVKGDNSERTEPLDPSFAVVQPALLRALEGVCLTGTASALVPKINEINGGTRMGGQRFTLFGKTGTLRDQYRTGRNDSNFIFAAGLWNPVNRTLNKGVVVSIFIEKGDRREEHGRAVSLAASIMDILNKHFGWSQTTAGTMIASQGNR